MSPSETRWASAAGELRSTHRSPSKSLSASRKRIVDQREGRFQVIEGTGPNEHRVHLGRRKSDGQAREFALRFEEALLTGDPSAAEAVAAGAIECELSVEEIYSRVITPAMVRIGGLWQHDEISVANEHLATAICQGVMARLFPILLRDEQRSRQRVMLAATQGEHHVLGLRMIADTLEGAGFDVRYLGADVPLEALLDACRVHRPAVLGLSTSMWLNVPLLLAAIRDIETLDHPPAIFVGGRAVGRAAENGLAVPVVQTCEEVVGVVTQLIERPQGEPAIDATLAARIPAQASSAPQPPGEGKLSVERAFSETALAAAEAVRESARHAFKLEELAYRDGLTGLWNRRAYDDRIMEMSDCPTPDAAALMLDVDEFKTVNDTYGHEAGDQALVAVGRAILKSIRPTDFGARFGGDEFVVLMPGMDPEGAAAAAERIRTAVQHEHSYPPITVSIGVAGLGQDTRQTSLSIDEALYTAKTAGRNRVVSAEV